MASKRLASRLYLLFTPELCAGDPWSTLRASLAGGVDLVQWRTVQPRRRDELGRALAICRDHGVPLIVNDDPALAVAAGADGAHVGQQDMPAAAARALLGDARWLGVSAHDGAQLVAAAAAGADYAGLGPCFATATKGYARGLAPAELTAGFALATVPVFAIGGITAANLPWLLARGARRIAVSSAVLGARDPAAAARELQGLLEAAGPGPGQSSSIASPNE